MVAKLTVYPTKLAASGRRWTPYDFVKTLGDSIYAQLFDVPFKTDPAMSFVIDQAAVEQFGEYIRTAIDLTHMVIPCLRTLVAQGIHIQLLPFFEHESMCRQISYWR